MDSDLVRAGTPALRMVLRIVIEETPKAADKSELLSFWLYRATILSRWFGVRCGLSPFG